MYHFGGSYTVKNMKDWRNEKTTTDPVKLLTPLTSYWGYNVGGICNYTHLLNANIGHLQTQSLAKINEGILWVYVYIEITKEYCPFHYFQILG